VGYDVFICHASEDKTAVVEPLVTALEERDLRVWLDQMEILIGDSLTQKIDEGLRHSRFGVVVVSPAVLAKEETGWVRRELDALAAREAQRGQVVVLPVWHEVGYEQVSDYSPTLAGKFAAKTKDGVESVAEMILLRCRAAASNTTVASAGPTADTPKTVEEPNITPTFEVPAFVAHLPTGSLYGASAWAPTAPGEPFVFRAEVLHPDSKPLVNRIVGLANMVLACAPGGHLQAPYKYPSAYGIEQDMADALARMERGEHIADEQATMTDALWTELHDIIEEMGRNGCKDYQLGRFLSRRPEPSECVHLSAELFKQASIMANRSRPE
jgi:hypothetical protein